MAFIAPFDHTYDDFVALSRRLRRDGTPVPADEVRPGDFTYLSDGPRLICEIDKHGRFGMPDTGGPITGGWTYPRQAYRGGTDHVMARADFQASRLERRKRECGSRHG